MKHSLVLATLVALSLAHGRHRHARAHDFNKRALERAGTTIYDIATTWTTVTITASTPSPSAGNDEANLPAVPTSKPVAFSDPAQSAGAHKVPNNPSSVASIPIAAASATAASSSAVAPVPAANSTPKSSFVAAAQASTAVASLNGGSSGPTQSGDVTYYATYNGLGRCGYYLSDTNNTCAVAVSFFNGKSSIAVNEPAPGTPCNKRINVYPNGLNEKSFQVIVADGCEGCDPQSLDLPQQFFEDNMPDRNGETPEQIGRYHNIQWQWAD